MDPRRGSFPVGSIFNIRVRLHVLFVALLAIQTLAAAGIGGRWFALYWFILLGPILLVRRRRAAACSSSGSSSSSSSSSGSGGARV